MNNTKMYDLDFKILLSFLNCDFEHGSVYLWLVDCKYIILQLQFFPISLQYDANLGDWMFLYIDLVITTSIAIFSKYTLLIM